MSKTVSVPQSDVEAARRPSRLAWIVPLVALAWLPIMLWASYGSIHSSGGGSVAVATAAQALPGVVQATFAAAVAAALLVGGASRVPAGWTGRVLASVAGVLVGVIAAAVVLAVYGHAGGLASVEAALVVIGLIGGAFGAADPIRTTVLAGLAGLLAALVIYRVLVARNVLTHTMKWFGASDTIASFLHASTRVAYANSAVAGAAAGWFGYLVLRRTGHRLRFPAYQLAGAFAGLTLLICELATRLGGANLLDVVKAISPEDRTLFDLARPANINNDLIVLFVGTLVAMIAFGRSLPPRAVASADSAASDQSGDLSRDQSSTDGNGPDGGSGGDGPGSDGSNGSGSDGAAGRSEQ